MYPELGGDSEPGHTVSRIVELLVGLNALGGIAAFLGIRWAGRKAHSQTLGRLRRAEETDDEKEPKRDDA